MDPIFSCLIGEWILSIILSNCFQLNLLYLYKIINFFITMFHLFLGMETVKGCAIYPGMIILCQ